MLDEAELPEIGQLLICVANPRLPAEPMPGRCHSRFPYFS